MLRLVPTLRCHTGLVAVERISHAAALSDRITTHYQHSSESQIVSDKIASSAGKQPLEEFELGRSVD